MDSHKTALTGTHLVPHRHEPDIWHVRRKEAKTNAPRCNHFRRSFPTSPDGPTDLTPTQTDARIASIEVNIKKLDGELMRYKEQMSKLRNGPGKVTTTSPRRPRTVLTSPNQRAIEQRALRVLRQKKMYESQLAQLSQQTFNMESAAIATENLRNTMATVEAMKVANKEIKKQYGKIDIDKIEVRRAWYHT